VTSSELDAAIEQIVSEKRNRCPLCGAAVGCDGMALR
jgi:hypothetical protein